MSVSGTSTSSAEKECTTAAVLAPDAILQHRLDAVDILMMTLQDIKFFFYPNNDPSQGTSDVLSLLERIEMCYRFIKSVSWSDRDGAIERIVLKLIEMHINLTNGKPIAVDHFNSISKDLANIEFMVTSQNNLDTDSPSKTSLLDRDFCCLKIMIVDRITRFLILGPLAFGNHSTFKLLEEIELCRRYLCDDDVDMRRLKRVSIDITVLLSLVHCYEIMEFWETINFKKWSLKSLKGTQNVLSLMLRHKKTYSASEIRREKTMFEGYWRKVLSGQSPNYRPPAMITGYPDHPYLSYEKRKRSLSRRDCKIKSETNSTAESISEESSRNSEGKRNKTADASKKPISSIKSCEKDSKDAKIANMNSSSLEVIGSGKVIAKTNSEIDRKVQRKTFRNLISVVHSERKSFACKLREQIKLCDSNLGTTKSAMFIRVGVPQNLLKDFYASLEIFFLSRFNRENMRDPNQLLQTVSTFRELCSKNSGHLLESLRDHVTVSVLDIVRSEDPRREGLVDRLMMNIEQRVKSLYFAVDGFEKCCVLLGEEREGVVEMARSAVKEVFKKLAIVCCTDKLVVSSDWWLNCG